MRYVVYLEINSLSLYVPKSNNQFYQGETDVKVTLVNVKKRGRPARDGRVPRDRTRARPSAPLTTRTRSPSGRSSSTTSRRRSPGSSRRTRPTRITPPSSQHGTQWGGGGSPRETFPWAFRFVSRSCDGVGFRSQPKGGAHGRADRDPLPRERAAGRPRGGQGDRPSGERIHRSARQGVRRPVPLRAVEEPSLLRRVAQNLRLPGRGAGPRRSERRPPPCGPPRLAYNHHCRQREHGGWHSPRDPHARAANLVQ